METPKNKLEEAKKQAFEERIKQNQTERKAVAGLENIPEPEAVLGLKKNKKWLRDNHY